MVLQPDIPDMTLWQARLSKALGITDPQVIGNVLSQLGSCAPDGNVEQMLNLALELLDEVKPRSPVETLLLAQTSCGLDLPWGAVLSRDTHTPWLHTFLCVGGEDAQPTGAGSH